MGRLSSSPIQIALTRPGVHEQARMQAARIDILAGKQKTRASTQTRAGGRPVEGPRSPLVLSQLLVTWVMQLQAQPETRVETDEGKWGDGKRETLRGRNVLNGERKKVER